MKEEDLKKYTDMCARIKSKILCIQGHMQYGLTRNEKAFLELVNDLLND